MNKVFLMGNLTRDPEVRYTTGENQMAIVRFGIAVNRRFSRNNQGTQPDVDFFNCVAFGRTGETISNYFTKGRKILVSGRLQTNNWEDNNGVKHYGMDIVVEDFEFCERRSEAEGSGSSGNGGGNYSAPKQSFGQSSPAKPAAGEKYYDVPDGVDEEDLPF